MKNPFEYEGANNLTTDEIIDFYIEDFNYSRFIQSNRNIFLKGERGTGKTMALLYNSFQVQYAISKRKEHSISFEKLGIHIPCNTPLFHKKEHQLIDEPFKASIVCEHYLVLTILSQIINSLIDVPEVISSFAQYNETLKQEFEYTLGVKLISELDFLKSVKNFVYKEVIETQRFINQPNSDAFYKNALSFSSLIIPFLESIRRVPLLRKSHFMLMIDDAHDLNEFQVQTLNSWIAYRDHTYYSFKVAIAKVGQEYTYITSSGGSILEGHDFTSVEMEKPFLNKESEFAKMAKRIIERRLEIFGVTSNIEVFFPINESFKNDLKKAESTTRLEAQKKYPDGTAKQINDYIYKYARVEYFRQRASKANRPPYSGFDTIINLSTGVIRNLLEPCYWMYDSVLSEQAGQVEQVTCIPATIQSRLILERSEAKWDTIRQLHRFVDGCTELQANQIYCLFENLVILFKQRLLKHRSEPRAIIFTISGKEKTVFDKITPLITIAQKAQLLYTRTGSSKDDGRREIYYVPNRMLLPSHGLDPLGQHAHIQLKATEILAAAEKNKPFPFVEKITTDQPTLFDE